MKKIRLTALLLSLVMMVALLPVHQASAAAAPVLNVSIVNPSLKPGDIVEVKWSVDFSGTPTEEATMLLASKTIVLYLYDPVDVVLVNDGEAKTGMSGTFKLTVPNTVTAKTGYLFAQVSFMNGATLVKKTAKVCVDGWYGANYWKDCKWLVNNWALDGGKWYYMDATGTKVTSKFMTIEDKLYNFNNDGVMQTGWKFRSWNGEWYYLNADGAAKTGGWLKDAGSWYYLGSNGEMYTGWLKTGDGVYYYLNSNGRMLTGWQQLSGDWFYFNASGAMRKNTWVQSNGSWFYLGGNGAMLESQWLAQGSAWYYLTSDGSMADHYMKIGGQMHHFAANGVWQDVK